MYNVSTEGQAKVKYQPYLDIVVLFIHLVQAHKCVESFSCCHRHLHVVFLQDQHVKHQLHTKETNSTVC